MLVKSLYERMKEIPDPRSNRKKPHNCAEVLTYLVMAYMSGRTAIRRALSWASEHESILKEYMDLSGGIASASTVSRLLSNIDEEMFILIFSDWASQLIHSSGIHIVIDGKALRAATEKIKNGNVPYILNAVEAATEIVITQLPIDTKTNEITAIPKLLKQIDFEGNMVTIDAIGTQIEIMEELDELKAGFMLQVKKNQPQMYEDIIGFFKELKEEIKIENKNSKYQSPMKELMGKCSYYETDEKNRERYEHREYTSCNDISCLTNSDKMPYLETVGITRQIRRLIVKDADGNDITPDIETFLKEGSKKQPKPENSDMKESALQIVGIISNKKLSAFDIGKLKRDHWKIENGLHHVLDDAFKEDRSPAKGSKNNLALIRKIAYNIIRYALQTLSHKKGIIEMMDYFSDNLENAAHYIFNPLQM